MAKHTRPQTFGAGMSVYALATQSTSMGVLTKVGARPIKRQTYPSYVPFKTEMSGLSTLWSEVCESLWPVVALADNNDDKDKSVEEKGEDKDEGDGDDDDEDEDEDEDEEEEGISDPMEVLRTKFTEGVCHEYKHHFDECAARVTAAQEEEDYEKREYKEDCVEEFFHWQHCLNENLELTLFRKLK